MWRGCQRNVGGDVGGDVGGSGEGSRGKVCVVVSRRACAVAVALFCRGGGFGEADG